jgi:tetratricopeptide (TPR) repeat protein
MPEIDAELSSALKQARRAPMRFAFVAKGPSEGKLRLAKKSVPAKDVAQARKDLGGGLVWKGRCFGEEGLLIFEVPKEPPATLAKQLKTIITRDAGMTLKVEVRVNSELEAEEGDEATAEQAAPPPAPPPPGAPPAAGDGMAKFTARLKTLLPEIIKAQAANSPVSQEVKLRASEAQTFARKQDFNQANALLDRVEKLLPQAGPATGAVPPAPPPPPSGDAAARVAARLKALMPVVQQAQGNGSPAAQEAKLRLSEAAVLARKKEFDQALTLLDRVEALLKQAPVSAAPPPPPSPPPPVDAAARFATRLKALMPQVQQAMASASPAAQEAKLRLSEAGVLAKKKEFDQANQLLDAVGALLKGAPAAPAAKPTSGKSPDPKILYGQARLEWVNARQKVRGELEKLEAAILEKYQQDPRLPDVKSSVRKLDTILKNLDEALEDKLDEAYNEAKEEKRNVLHKQATRLIASYLSYVNSDPLVAQLKDNPLVPVTVQETLTGTLTTLAERLA